MPRLFRSRWVSLGLTRTGSSTSSVMAAVSSSGEGFARTRTMSVEGGGGGEGGCSTSLVLSNVQIRSPNSFDALRTFLPLTR